VWTPMVVVHSVRVLHNIDAKGDGRCVGLTKLVGLNNQSVSTATHLTLLYTFMFVARMPVSGRRFFLYKPTYDDRDGRHVRSNKDDLLFYASGCITILGWMLF
jgi:hypothetical protein